MRTHSLMHMYFMFDNQATSGKATDSENDGPILLANPNGRDSRIKAEKELKVSPLSVIPALKNSVQIKCRVFLDLR